MVAFIAPTPRAGGAFGISLRATFRRRSAAPGVTPRLLPWSFFFLERSVFLLRGAILISRSWQPSARECATESNPRFDSVAHSRADGCQLREIRIAPRSKKTERSKKKKDQGSSRGVTPGAAERLRKVARKEIPNAPPALGVGAINATMGANHQAIEIIDQPRVAGFGASNCKIRSRAAIDAPQFAHLVALQATQCHLIETLKQFLEPLPDVLAFIDESIKGHGLDFGLRIADFGFVILDLD